MSFETVQAYFEQFGMADRCMDLKESSATVALRGACSRYRGGAHCKDAFFSCGRSACGHRDGRGRAD